MLIARQLAILTVIGACLLGLPSVAAAQAPINVLLEIPTASLSGQGSFSWFGFKLYDAKFWVGSQGYKLKDPWAAPFALDLVYARSIPGARITKTSEDEIARLDYGTDEQRAAWSNTMQQLFPDVQEGSRLTGIFIPRKGVRFYLDGEPLRVIADETFARAFFSIWLDPRTSAPELRSALLSSAR